MLRYDERDAFCHGRDVASGDIRSPTDQPALHRASRYEVAFARSAAFYRDEYDIQTLTAIAVSPENDMVLAPGAQ
jgi:hypothetical protein